MLRKCNFWNESKKKEKKNRNFSWETVLEARDWKTKTIDKHCHAEQCELCNFELQKSMTWKVMATQKE